MSQNNGSFFLFFFSRERKGISEKTNKRVIKYSVKTKEKKENGKWMLGTENHKKGCLGRRKITDQPTSLGR